MNVVSATVLDPPTISPSSRESRCCKSADQNNLSRIDYQLTPITLTVRYQYFRDVAANAGVGQFISPETGSNTLGVETPAATDTQSSARTR